MNASIVLWSVSTIVLVLFPNATGGCGGLKLDIEYIRNCDSGNVVQLSENFTVVMKDNCDVIISGCITTHDNVTRSEIEYTVQKDKIKRSGKKDGCNMLDNKPSEVELGLEILGLPKHCPVNKGTVCLGNKSINVNKYKLRMNVLAGRLKGKALVTTDTGKSCMEFSAKLYNAQLMKALLPPIGHMGTIG